MYRKKENICQEIHGIIRKLGIVNSVENIVPLGKNTLKHKCLEAQESLAVGAGQDLGWYSTL